MCRSQSTTDTHKKAIWWPGADKIAGSDFGHAKRARRVQARDGLHLSTTDTRIFSEQISQPYIT
jgi:hypothetical protein